MNEILLLFLSLSLSGSILALILLSLRPFVKNRLSQTWQYYIWLVVILRLLLPFTPEVSVAGEGVRYIQNTINSSAIVTADPGVDGGGTIDATPQAPNDVTPETPQADGAEQQASGASFPWREILNYSWLLWLGTALVLLVHKVESYRSFSRFVRAGAKKVTDIRILDIYAEIHAETKLKRPLPLFQNEQVSSPMLVGILRPMVVLPPLNATDDELRGIFRHELIHFRRLDFAYKWLVQIALCLHWFNPLVYAVGKQINQCCELSCDEAVIRRLDEDARISYGDALITSLEAQGSYSDFVVSITMSENATLVKERLDTIMGYKKKTKGIFFVSTLLTLLLLCGFSFTGAYAAENSSNINSTNQWAASAPPVSNTIDSVHLLAENCNVTVRYSVNDQVLFDYDQSKHKVTQMIDGAKLKINIERLGMAGPSSLTDMVIIYLPPKTYDNITVEGNKAGIALPEFNSHLHLTNDGGSMSVQVPEGFDKSIGFISKNGSGALTIDDKAANYHLSVTSNGSAVGISPEFPAYIPNRPWEYKNGNGKAQIKIDLQGCSFSIALASEKSGSEAEGTKNNPATFDMTDPDLNPTEPEGTIDNPATFDMTDPDVKGAVVINLSNNKGQNNIVHSSSFQASAGQVLTLDIKSNISGTVDLFLFSPSNKEKRITIGGNSETQTINLSEGRWAYNCTGFFDSGNISIVGTIK